VWLLILITFILHFAASDAELNQLKMLVEQLADKVNARGDTPAERLAAVEHRVDEVATHDICLGTTLGLAAMATHTDVDYSTRSRGFRGGAPEDAKTDPPWRKIRRKSLIRQSVSTVQTKTLRIREENPAAWYSNNARWPVITPNALSQSIK
jgi:hypothetical protein